MTLAQVSEMIRRGFLNAAVFSGRDSPAQFWPYAIFLTVAAVAAWTLVMSTTFAGFLGPGLAVSGYSGEELAQQMGTAFHHALLCLSILGAVMVALLAAAVARRLHDRNLSGLWGLLPVPFLVAGIVLSARVFDHVLAEGADSGSLAIMAANNLVYLASLLALALLLVLRGKAGPNRYGVAPSAPPEQP